jgi:hypothetical protein
MLPSLGTMSLPRIEHFRSGIIRNRKSVRGKLTVSRGSRAHVGVDLSLICASAAAKSQYLENLFKKIYEWLNRQGGRRICASYNSDSGLRLCAGAGDLS